jgi:hypothetical protein
MKSKIDKIYALIKKEIILYEHQYGTVTLLDENLIESYVFLSELLNPINAFPYKQKMKGWFDYKDSLGNKYFARIIYQPTTTPYFEFKTGYYDDLTGKPTYEPQIHPNSTAKDWDKRSDTVAKIWINEIIPFFINQKLSNKLILRPLDNKRYIFWKRFVNKFPIQNSEIIKNNADAIIFQKNSNFN